MACSTGGQNLIIVLADAAVASFEAIVPVLEAQKTITVAQGTAITTYVSVAVATLDTVIADVQSGTSTLVQIAAIVQTVVTAYDNLALAGIPANVTLWINVANIGIQTLLAAINAEIGTSGPSAPAAVEPIHSGFFENRKLSGLEGRAKKAQKEIAAIIAVKTSGVVQ